MRSTPAAAAVLCYAILLALSQLRALASPLFLDLGLGPLDVTVGDELAADFDYIVVGGGTAGLAVASRLAANLSTTVLVIEAGQNQEDNPGVYTPGLAGSTIGSGIDWSFNTVPQAGANGRQINWPRGKALGGSSTINFLAYTRGFKAEYDSWNTLGATGWNWAALLPYFKKAQNFHPPQGNSQNEPVDYDATVNGNSGPIEQAYPPWMPAQFVGYFKAVRALGVPAAKDQGNGHNVGTSYIASTMSPDSYRRQTAVGYLDSSAQQPNLVVLTSARVTRVNWSGVLLNTSVVASSVTFVGSDGIPVNVTANREVILSAGSVQTPQLLELSGVGNPVIMNPLGISTVVNLPGVGENLQDHPTVLTIHRLKPGVQSLDNLHDPTYFALAEAQYQQAQGPLTSFAYPLAYLKPSHFLTSAEIQTAINLQSTPPVLPSKQQSAQTTQWAAGAPVIEVIPANAWFSAGTDSGAFNTSYISMAVCLQHSYSRGSIHITSADPLAPPAIDPKYLSAPIDKYLLAKGAQYNRKIAARPQLAQYIDAEVVPGPPVQTQAQWEAWVKQTVSTEFHPIGTASMLPRADKGVVNPQLVVYGTANLRVVDLSVVPLHVSSHTQSVAYAIGERAADIILSGQ